MVEAIALGGVLLEAIAYLLFLHQRMFVRAIVCLVWRAHGVAGLSAMKPTPRLKRNGGDWRYSFVGLVGCVASFVAC